MKKIVWIIGIVALVLIIGAVVVVGLFLDKIVKKGVETVGPKIVQVPVSVDTINLALMTGSAKVRGLVVGNPEGCKSTNAITVGVVAVAVDPLTVFSDKIVVRSIEVRQPEITFEGGLSGNNLSKILDNVNSTAKNGGPPSTNKTAAASSKPAKKIEVDDLLITGAKIHVILTQLGGKEMNLTLPDIHLVDLGKDGDGITPTDLTRRVLSAITTGTIKAVANAGTQITQGAEDMGKEGVNKFKKGVSGLFGK
jgi:hypothetical protein